LDRSLQEEFAPEKSEVGILVYWHLGSSHEHSQGFVNRAFEVFIMAIGFLRFMTIKNPHDLPRPMMSTCQMFGSGKTQLGYHFLDVFNSSRFEDHRRKLTAVFGREPVEALSRVTYVHVNLKNYTKKFEAAKSTEERAAVLQTAVLTAIINTKKIKQDRIKQLIGRQAANSMFEANLTYLLDYHERLLLWMKSISMVHLWMTTRHVPSIPCGKPSITSSMAGI